MRGPGRPGPGAGPAGRHLLPGRLAVHGGARDLQLRAGFQAPPERRPGCRRAARVRAEPGRPVAPPARPRAAGRAAAVARAPSSPPPPARHAADLRRQRVRACFRPAARRVTGSGRRQNCRQPPLRCGPASSQSGGRHGLDGRASRKGRVCGEELLIAGRGAAGAHRARGPRDPATGRGRNPGSGAGSAYAVSLPPTPNPPACHQPASPARSLQDDGPSRQSPGFLPSAARRALGCGLPGRASESHGASESNGPWMGQPGPAARNPPPYPSPLTPLLAPLPNRLGPAPRRARAAPACRPCRGRLPPRCRARLTGPCPGQ
jgi:hypothetical protein